MRPDNSLAVQQNLFGGSVTRSPRPAPLARSADPISSHIAADAITASGLRASQKRAILEALRDQPEPCTSLELARAAGFDRYTVARRLPDLARDELVQRGPMRNCRISETPAVTWSAKAVRP